MDNSHNFIEYALACEAIKLGQFQLKSGRTSPYFFNSGVFSNGEALQQLGGFYADAIIQSNIEFDMLFGPAYKGIPLVCATANGLGQRGVNKPFAFNRKEEKDHGEGGDLIGSPLKGRVLIIDDVISAGTAVRHSLELVRAYSAQAVALAVLFNRQEKGIGNIPATVELMEEFKLKTISVATLEDLLIFVKEEERYKGFLGELKKYQKLYA